LRDGDVITTSTWTADRTDVTMDNDGNDALKSWVRVTAVPAATSFTLTNHVVVTRADAKVEEFDRSMIVKIKDL